MKIEYINCDKCGLAYRQSGLKKCKHEAVNAIYGKNICRYCCMKCKYYHNGFCEYCQGDKKENLKVSDS